MAAGFAGPTSSGRGRRWQIGARAAAARSLDGSAVGERVAVRYRCCRGRRRLPARGHHPPTCRGRRQRLSRWPQANERRASTWRRDVAATAASAPRDAAGRRRPRLRPAWPPTSAEPGALERWERSSGRPDHTLATARLARRGAAADCAEKAAPPRPRPARPAAARRADAAGEARPDSADLPRAHANALGNQTFPPTPTTSSSEIAGGRCRPTPTVSFGKVGFKGRRGASRRLATGPSASLRARPPAAGEAEVARAAHGRGVQDHRHQGVGS